MREVETIRAPLAGWLRERLGQDLGTDPGPVAIGGLTRPTVGQSSETLIFDAAWQQAGQSVRADLVLRMQPGPGGIFLRPDAVREGRVLAGLETGTAPVPRVRWIEPGASVFGVPFFVMDRVHGVVPAGKPSVHAAGWLPTLAAEQRARAVESAIDAMAAVHAADWQRTHGFLRPPGAAGPGLTSHLDGLADWYEWAAAGRTFAITDEALAYLRRERGTVVDGEPVLLWGDARIGNVLFDPDTCLVNAILDWECAALGPAEVDLAHWLVFDELSTAANQIEPLTGYPVREQILARYESASGRAVPTDLLYFEIMQCFFLATTIIRQTDAAVRAGHLDRRTRMGHDNTLTQMLARRLELPVPPVDPDYVAHRSPQARRV
jgi:aminoglycoside phosphotransferase (APT) family kinase protein